MFREVELHRDGRDLHCFFFLGGGGGGEGVMDMA